MKEFYWMVGYMARKALPGDRFLQLRRRAAAWKRFWRSYSDFCKAAGLERKLLLKDLNPRLGDDLAQTPIEPIYFYQDAWAFERIVRKRPARHIDVGSHHKYVALLSKVVPVTMVDIRPLSLEMNSIHFMQGSLTKLPFEDQTIESMSSLCVVEHVGLGRYGDSIDPEGTEKAISELCRVIAPGGRLYLSLPVGDRSFVAFNAGRVLTLNQVRDLTWPLTVVDQFFIVGTCFQKEYRVSDGFGTTGLFELTRGK